MNDLGNLNDLERAVLSFLDSFENVFGCDWEFSRQILADPEFYIMPGATFLHPGVDDEGNNWSNRGALLAAYRRLKQALVECGLDGACLYGESDDPRLRFKKEDY